MIVIVAISVMLFMAMFSARTLFGKDKYIKIGLLFFSLMMLALVARISIALLGYYQLLTVVAWIGYIAIGVVSILFCAAVLKLIINTSGYAFGKTSTKFSPSRRKFLTNTAGSAMSLAVLPMSGYGVYKAVGEPVIKEVTVKRKNTPKGLKGLKIVQLSDIHVGLTIGSGTVRNIVSKANSLEADIIVITGDLVDGSADFISEYIEPLKDLRAKHGVYFVTGNHEYYSGAESWIDRVTELGIKVLDNSNDVIEHNGAKLLMAGIPDIESSKFGFGKYSPEKAKVTTEDYDFSVILSHRPEIAREIAKHGYDLQLSGHTHGGQYFPWTIVIYLFHEFVKGLHKVEGMHLYVSQGTAYWGPPLRIGAESEISVIELA